MKPDIPNDEFHQELPIEVKLDRCPFCGGQPFASLKSTSIVTDTYNKPSHYRDSIESRVTCTLCLAEVKAYGKNETEALTRVCNNWNNRFGQSD